MYASDAIKELQELVAEHGDVPLTVSVGKYEYGLREPGFVVEGPLRNLGETQGQNPPARIVFEGKDEY